jgi:hypothetical protein
VTIQQLTPSVDVTINWGDGTAVETIAAGRTTTITHAYATPGSYPIVVSNADALTAVDLRVAQISGLDTADLRGAVLTHFWVNGLGAAATNRVASSDMTAWRPTNWYLFSMPAGTYTITSSDMTAWRPAHWLLYSMPAGAITDITAASFSGWVGCSDFQIQDNGLSQTQVNAILWGLYQASVTPRTASGGTINVGGTNAAPSGTFQAAGAPVTAATDGKEIAHELLNDGQAVGFNKWATVTITA